MLFGCQDPILAFDNNRVEAIPGPGTGYIRWLKVDGRGVVWFGSSTQIGYLSRVDGKYRLVKVYSGSFGPHSQAVVAGGRVYLSSETGLIILDSGHISQQPWSREVMDSSSLALRHRQLLIRDRHRFIH